MSKLSVSQTPVKYNHLELVRKTCKLYNNNNYNNSPLEPEVDSDNNFKE